MVAKKVHRMPNGKMMVGSKHKTDSVKKKTVRRQEKKY